MDPATLPQLELSTDSLSLWMNCPQCKAFLKSTDFSITLVGCARGPAGHNHDQNCRRFFFRCVCGLAWTYRPRNICPKRTCDWKGPADCSTCGLFYVQN